MRALLTIMLFLSSSVGMANQLVYEKDRDAQWYPSHYEKVESRLDINGVETDGLEMYAIKDQRSRPQKDADMVAGIARFPYYIRIEHGAMVMRCKLSVLTKIGEPEGPNDVELGLCKIQMLK